MTQLEQLQGLSDALVAARAPGAAVWVQDERSSLQAAGGLADLDTGRPMRPELHFRAGSVTKSFVAAVVLRLVTVRQLLNHTGGVPHDTAPSKRRCTRPGREASVPGSRRS